MVELLVSALQDVELGVVEAGVLVHGAVALAHEAAHARPALRRELAVEDDDHALVRAGRQDGGAQEVVLHVLLLVQVQSPLVDTGRAAVRTGRRGGLDEGSEPRPAGQAPPTLMWPPWNS